MVTNEIRYFLSSISLVFSISFIPNTSPYYVLLVSIVKGPNLKIGVVYHTYVTHVGYLGKLSSTHKNVPQSCIAR
jgi:hypothetical protein